MALAKPVSQEKLAEYCRANGIKWLAAHDAEIVQRNFPDVDLFLLVEFEEDCRIGYMTLLRIERELASLFGKVNTDLRTLPELRGFYRDEVLASVEAQFAA